MKTNVKKITGFAAIAVFIMALAINVKVTLDDPFTMVSEKALAQQTTEAMKYLETEIDCDKTCYGPNNTPINTTYGKLVFCLPYEEGSTACTAQYCNAPDPCGEPE